MKPVAFTSQSLRGKRGLITFCVLILSMASVLLIASMFLRASGVAITGSALDAVRSQLVEKNGVAAIVKESILAVRETAPTNSANSIAQEINNRLAAASFAPGVSVTLSSSAAVPAHTFYPWGTAPAAGTLALLPTSPPALGGQGNLAIGILDQGPAADMGTLTFQFARSVSGSPSESRTYTVNAELYSVPVTNYDMVAYGLPSSGSIPAAAPAMASGFFGAGVSRLVVTSNNPSNDPTAYPDLYSPSAPEVLPGQYRNAVSFAWNAYEYIWSSTYQNELGTAAGAGNIFNTTNPSNPTIPGVSAVGSAITVNIGSVTSPIVEIVDPLGTASVTVTGSSSGGNAFILVVESTGGTQIGVTFTGNNSRPFLFYGLNCALGFAGTPQIEAGMLLDRNCSCSGNAILFGHFSFYASASPFPTFNLSLNDNSTVKSALAAIAPRVLLVAAKATR